MAMRSLAKKVKEDSTLIQSKSCPLQVYKIPMEKVMYDGAKGIAKYSYGKPTRSRRSNEKVIMVVGATGVGKTTLIEGMVNYIFGVKWEDDFRFKLAFDEDGPTKMITSYTIYPQEESLTLTIIDTPGFGDTHKDKLITQQMQDFFAIKGPNCIDHVDAIVFVAEADLPYLSPTHNYVFNSIFAMFGRNVANNIFIMATFADRSYTRVMDAIKKARIPHIAYYQFNNSSLFANNVNEEFAMKFWHMGMKSFERFLDELRYTRSINLQEILEERKHLEYTIQRIQEKIDAGVSKLEELHQERRVLEKKEAEISANKDFTYKVTVSKSRKVNVRSGVYVTNCLTCNYTCHDNCCYSNDKDKYQCSAMDGGGQSSAKCRVCPNKCSWRQHVNNPYYFEWYEETETRKSDDLEKRFYRAMEEKDRAKHMMKEIENYLRHVEADIMGMINEIQRAIAHLDSLGLKPNSLTKVEHLDLLIKSEKQQARAGYKQRIQFYEQAKEQVMIMNKAEHDLGDLRLSTMRERSHDQNPWYAEFKRW